MAAKIFIDGEAGTTGLQIRERLAGRRDLELLSIAADKLSLDGGFWSWVAGIDLNAVGYVVVGLFVATWAVALGVWRFGHLEERWALPAASRERA